MCWLLFGIWATLYMDCLLIYLLIFLQTIFYVWSFTSTTCYSNTQTKLNKFWCQPIFFSALKMQNKNPFSYHLFFFLYNLFIFSQSVLSFELRKFILLLNMVFIYVYLVTSLFSLMDFIFFVLSVNLSVMSDSLRSYGL